MALDRNAILAALQSRMEGVASLRFVARRELDSSQVPRKPACIIIGDEQTGVASPGEPTVWTMLVWIIVYCPTDKGEPIVPSDGTINTVIHDIEAALEPGDCETETLGGICDRCSIEGTIDIAGGSQDGGEYIARIPVLVHVPAVWP